MGFHKLENLETVNKSRVLAKCAYFEKIRSVCVIHRKQRLGLLQMKFLNKFNRYQLQKNTKGRKLQWD